MNYQGRDNLKVLVVFPDVTQAIQTRRRKLGLPEIEVSELEYGDEEVAEIVNQLGAKLLPGKRATIFGFLDILQEGWDIIWLITHGEEEGWYLHDGLVNASEMTTLVRSSGTFLTVMNTCSSFEVAKAAAAELGTAFICTLTAVPDRQAFLTGALFAQKLAAGYDYATAFRLVAPGQKHPYILIEASDAMRPDRPPYQRGNQSFENETLNRIVRSVEELQQIVHGSERLKLPGLQDLMQSIQADLKAIKIQLDKIEERQRVRNTFMWGMGISILVLLAAVAILISQIGVTS